VTELAAAVEITNPTGLHARPAVKLTKLAKGFGTASVAVALSETGPWIDAKSVVKIMALKAPRGAVLHLRAHGEGAAEALAALAALVRRDFDEAGHAAPDHVLTGAAADASG
jgi:phosphocarrier protein